MIYWLLSPTILNKIWMSILCIQLLFFYASISKASDVNLPKPFKIESSTGFSQEHFKVAQRCHIEAEIVRKKYKLYLRVNLYYRGVKIAQNQYEIDPKEVAKL